jgi:predicted DNA-binding transcriptional regulator AlpA
MGIFEMETLKIIVSPRGLDEEQAATYTGMSVSFLQKSRSTGQTGSRTPGPRFKKIGKRVIYDLADLDAWLNSFQSYNHNAEALADQ